MRQRERKIRRRLDKRTMPEHVGPMLNPGNIHYEISDRNRGVLYGGMGAVQLLVKRLELDEAINRYLRLLTLHHPYYESDHVLNIAYNLLCNGQCLEDIERLLNDEVYWNKLKILKSDRTIEKSPLSEAENHGQDQGTSCIHFNTTKPNLPKSSPNICHLLSRRCNSKKY